MKDKDVTISWTEYDSLLRQSLVLDQIMAHEDESGTIIIYKLDTEVFKSFLRGPANDAD